MLCCVVHSNHASWSLTERDVTLILPNAKIPGIVILLDFESREDGRVILLVLSSFTNGI